MSDFKAFGFGYQGQAITRFVAQVKELGALVCDIRYQPFSRAVVWRKSELEKALGTGHYHYIKELGNVNYRGGEICIADLEKGIAAVITKLEKQHIILMCVCPNPLTCHRATVAQALSAYNVEVEEFCIEPQEQLPLW